MNTIQRSQQNFRHHSESVSTLRDVKQQILRRQWWQTASWSAIVRSQLSQKAV